MWEVYSWADVPYSTGEPDYLIEFLLKEKRLQKPTLSPDKV